MPGRHYPQITQASVLFPLPVLRERVRVRVFCRGREKCTLTPGPPALYRSTDRGREATKDGSRRRLPNQMGRARVNDKAHRRRLDRCRSEPRRPIPAVDVAHPRRLADNERLGGIELQPRHQPGQYAVSVPLSGFVCPQHFQQRRAANGITMRPHRVPASHHAGHDGLGLSAFVLAADHEAIPVARHCAEKGQHPQKAAKVTSIVLAPFRPGARQNGTRALSDPRALRRRKAGVKSRARRDGLKGHGKERR
jgi:hypothetical protein